MTEKQDKILGFRSVGELITILIPIGFVISVLYDWGFFYALDLGFNFIPTKVSDHFRSGLLWFPPLLFVAFVIFAIEFQFQKIERGLSEEEIIENSPNPKRLKAFREGPHKFAAWIAPLILITFALIGDHNASGLPFALSVTWLVFANWCYSSPLIQMRRNPKVQLAFVWLPIIGLFAFSSGYSSAVYAANNNQRKVTITIDAKLEKINASFLRTFESGTLILDESKIIRFIPSSKIQSIHFHPQYKRYEGILCNWFKLCPERKSGTPQ